MIGFAPNRGKTRGGSTTVVGMLVVTPRSPVCVFGGSELKFSVFLLLSASHGFLAGSIVTDDC